MSLTSSQRRSLHWHLCLDRYIFPGPLWRRCCTSSYRSTNLLREDPDFTIATQPAATTSSTMPSSSTPLSLSATPTSASSSAATSSARKHITVASASHHYQDMISSWSNSQVSTLAILAAMPMPMSLSHAGGAAPSSRTGASVSSSSSSPVGMESPVVKQRTTTPTAQLASSACALTALTSTAVEGQHTRSGKGKGGSARRLDKSHFLPQHHLSLTRIRRPNNAKKSSRQRSSPPCTVRCFSPLDLPPELFMHLMQFLSPSDLWRLCQVSRAMQAAILQTLLPLQAAALNVVRTLHQESGDSSLDEMYHHGVRTWYERMTTNTTTTTTTLSPSTSATNSSFTLSSSGSMVSSSSTTPSLFSAHQSVLSSSSHYNPPNSSSSSSSLRLTPSPSTNHGGLSMTLFTAFPGRPKSQGQVQRRSDYWKTQAKRLVAIVAKSIKDGGGGGNDGCSSNLDEYRTKGGLRRTTTPHRALSQQYATITSTQQQAHYTSNSNHTSAQAQGYVFVNNDHANNSSPHDGNGSIHHVSNMQSFTGSFVLPSSSTSSSSSSTSTTTAAAAALSRPLFMRNPHIVATTTGRDNKQKGAGTGVVGIPKDRLLILVDMIFDPLLVALEHRRAIINCARYVSAEIDTFHKETLANLKLTDPNHPLLRREAGESVYLGPYLTIAMPTPLYEHASHFGEAMEGWAALDGLGPSSPSTSASSSLGLGQQSQHEDDYNDNEEDEMRWLTHVEPPARLRSFFQRMLWYRCLTDLISIYNKIHERHIPVPASNSNSSSRRGSVGASLHHSDAKRNSFCNNSHGCTASSSARTTPPASTGDVSTSASRQQKRASIYPFCCKAHSLVFSSSLYTTPHGPSLSSSSTPLSSVSLATSSWVASSRYTLFGLRAKLRQTMTDLQRAYHNFQWTLASFGLDPRPPLDMGGRIVRPAFQSDKLVFCNAATPAAGMDKNSAKNEKEEGTEMEDDDSDIQLRRRYMIEDAVRRDNLMKQELLGLCHIACGLFTVDTAHHHHHHHHHHASRRGRQPPTLMSLLRQGSPWRKGVWREGEWRSSAIDWNVTVDPPTLSSIASPSSSGPTTNSSTSWTSNMRWEAEAEQGEWQKICLAAIQFLIREDLAWGGNKANEELSLLKVTTYGSAWVYHE